MLKEIAKKKIVFVLLIIFMVTIANTAVYAKTCLGALEDCLIAAGVSGIAALLGGASAFGAMAAYAAFCGVGFSFCILYSK